MKLKDIKIREKAKERIKEQIKELYMEIEMMQDAINNGLSENQTIIGDATILSDIEQEDKERIYEFLGERYEEEIIVLNQRKIKYLKESLKKQLKQF